MRVVVNQQAALGLKTGIGHYTTELLRCLRQQAGPQEIEAYPEGWVRWARDVASRARPFLEARGHHKAPDQNTTNSRFTTLRRAAIGRLRQTGRTFISRHFQHTCRRRRYDLYHEPNFTPLPTDCPTIATLHDLSVLLYPQWHPADRVAHFMRHFPEAMRHCVHFLTVSDFTRQEVIRTLGIAPEKVTRTYNGYRRSMAPLSRETVAAILKRLDLPARYLLHVGTIEPRKNVKLLLQAYCSLPASLRERWPLLLVGSWGWNTAEVAEYYHAEARHRGVLHLGYVAEAHMAVLYNGARALLFPSLYEGFGMPPIEMMACGGAVLASTAEALVETVGRKAHLLSPHDIDAWRAAMQRVVEDDDWWRKLRDGVIEDARPFTWERCAADTLRVYRSLTGTATLPLAA
jgi:alpha-1,3-rhamnosyl/mannosyltransferase